MIVGFTKSPCKDCTDRHENCHTEECAAWTEWQKIHNEERNKAYRKRIETEGYKGYAREQLNKVYKIKRSRGGK